MLAASLCCARSQANVEIAFGRNLVLNKEAIAQVGTIAAYASYDEAKPRLPFWDLLLGSG
jgi:hypothetical protein